MTYRSHLVMLRRRGAKLVMRMVAAAVYFLSSAPVGASPSDDHELLMLLQGHIDAMNAAAASAARRAHVVSGVLLVGLLVEIVGALFLAGPALTAKQELVMSLDATAGYQDLTMQDTGGERRMNFLGAIGAMLLTLGFVIQFGGTLVSFGVAWPFVVAGLLTSTVFALAVFHFLLGLSPDQTRYEKLQMVWKNSRRLVPDGGCRCDVCNRRVTAATGAVHWRDSPQRKLHPFIHPPRDWHVGHSHCLDESDWFRPLVSLAGEAKEVVERASLREFLDQVPDFERWWQKWREHYAKMPSAHGRTADNLVHPAEHEFRAVLKKVRRLSA